MRILGLSWNHGMETQKTRDAMECDVEVKEFLGEKKVPFCGEVVYLNKLVDPIGMAAVAFPCWTGMEKMKNALLSYSDFTEIDY